MAKEKRPDIKLPSLDDLFSTQEMREQKQEGVEQVVRVPRSQIDPFPNHPFKVKIDDDMMKMVDSIKQYGVLSPAILRPKEDGRYEMVAGHRREKGSELAGIDDIPAIVRNMSDDEAIILMVDSNLQREKILPSEKAFAYKMKLEAMKRQAGRPKMENGSPVGNNLGKTKSSDELAEEVGESKTQIFRYIRLTELIPELLEMVDEEKIALRPAVELSYIPQELQKELLETMSMEDCTPSYAQTVKMRKLLADDKLTPEVIWSIMQEEKPNQREKIVLRDERVRKLIPKNIPITQTEDYVIKALEYYGRYRERKELDRQVYIYQPKDNILFWVGMYLFFGLVKRKKKKEKIGSRERVVMAFFHAKNKEEMYV